MRAYLDTIDQRALRVRQDLERLTCRHDTVTAVVRQMAPRFVDPSTGPLTRGQVELKHPVSRDQAKRTKRGIDGHTVNLNDLLDKAEVDRIDRRFTAGFDVRTSLDRYDVAGAIVAGLLGALIDILVVRVPTNTVWQGDWFKGSALTRAFRARALGHDNWLSSFARVPFDKVVGTGIYAMSPMTHRVQTFGQDPLFGLVLGTMDIMRGSLTAVGDRLIQRVPGRQPCAGSWP